MEHATQSPSERDFVAYIRHESARGAVLCAHAFLEYELKRTLMTKLVAVGADRKKLAPLFDDDSGELRGGPALDRLAYALGLIDDPTRQALAAVRKLRNKFAHKLERKSLTKVDVASISHHLDPTVLDMIIGSTDHRKDSSPQYQFCLAALEIIVAIRRQSRSIIVRQCQDGILTTPCAIKPGE